MASAYFGSLAVLFVLWLAIALGCAVGAKSIMVGKGRSGSAGFWLGLCLGLTGLLIAALLSSTPEHEARKMQMQMQMMGIAPPPPGAMVPSAMAPGAMPPMPFASAPNHTSTSTEPSVIIALVVSGLYAIAWVVGGYEFEFAFGGTKVVALFVFATGLTLSVVALTKKKSLFVGLASGAALGIGHLGFFAVATVVGGFYRDTNVQLAFIPVDIAAVVGAALILSRSADQPPPATAVAWWKQASIGLAAGGVVLTLIASQQDLLARVVANAAVWGGFVVAGLALVKGGRVPLALAVAWSATTVVYLVGTEFRGLGSSTTLQGVVMLIALGIAGLAAWALQQLDPADAKSLASVAAPPAPPPPVVTPAFAPAPPPPPPHGPSEFIAEVPGAPSQLAVAPTASPAPAPSHDATMPRSRPVPVAQLRFASGELVGLTSTLILGRAPVAPMHLQAAATFVVSDPSFTISSTHCLISLDNGAVWVEDLGSTNGTEVVSPSGTTELGAGQRMLLTPVDRVQLGDNWCRIES